VSAPLAVFVGGIGKLPYGGITMYYVHHVLGLLELGYRVHYVERQNRELETYDPAANEMTDRPDFAVRHLAEVAGRFGFGDRWSFIDRAGTCHGAGWDALRASLDDADFVLTVADPTWFDELERCERRIFIDGDPMFTQVAFVTGEGPRADPPRHYDVLFTYAARIGRDDCLVPDGGRDWLPARPVVATSHWTCRPPPAGAPFAALMHWAAGSEVHHDGRAFGHKDREFARIAGLPTRRAGEYLLAASGRRVPRDALARVGWRIESPLHRTATADDLARFIAGSRADIGVAKHAYVASRSGWFSDRSTCFLASGRPVLHQDTGYTDWLPAEAGVIPFSDVESLAEALDRVDRDYDLHARAARRVAEEHFEAREVLGGMLATAGVR
jgi:hypothetical protein